MNPSISKLMMERTQSGSSGSQPDEAADIAKSLPSTTSTASTFKLPRGVKDEKGRAKSRAYLQQCLQEIAYLTSDSTLNPLGVRNGAGDAPTDTSLPSRPSLTVPDVPSMNPTSSEGSEGTAISGFVAEELASDSLKHQTAAEPSRVTPSSTTVVEEKHSHEPISRVQPPTSVPDVQLWHPKGTMSAHFSSVRALAYDASGQGLFTASDDCTIKYWHLPTNDKASASASVTTSITNAEKWEHLMTLRGHEKGVKSLVFSKRLNRLYSAGEDGRILQWDIPADTPESDKSISSPLLPTSFVKTEQGTQSLALFPSNGQDDALLASVCAQGQIQLWFTDDQMSPRLFMQWDYFGTEPSEEAQKERQAMASMPVPTSITKCPADVKACVVAFNNGVIRFFSLTNGRAIKSLTSPSSTAPANVVVGHPTLPSIAAGYEDNYIHLFDLETGSAVLSLHAHDDGITCLDIDPSGLTLVSGSHDCKIRFWDVRYRGNNDTDAVESHPSYSAVCFQEILAHQSKAQEGVLAVLYHPALPLVATAGADGFVHLYG